MDSVNPKRKKKAPQNPEKGASQAIPTEGNEAKAEPQKKKTGRPKGSGSKYTEELADKICDQVSNGIPLRVVCRTEGMPSWRTVYDWCNAHPSFATRLAHARDMGYDALAEEALDISNTPVSGTKKVYSSGADKDKDSMTVTEEDMLGHRKLQIETRLKLLACWNPKKYGNKVAVGGDEENPLKATVDFSLFETMLTALETRRQAKE